MIQVPEVLVHLPEYERVLEDPSHVMIAVVIEYSDSWIIDKNAYSFQPH